MVLKVDQITNYVLMLNEDEIDTIISALYEADEDDLADEISEEVFGEDEACDSCDCESGNIGTLTIDVDTKAAVDGINKVKQAADNATASIAKLEEKFFGGKALEDWLANALGVDVTPSNL